MARTTPNRRDVLKTVGAAGSLGVVGIATGSGNELGSVRFIEAGLVHDLPDSHPYHGFGRDGLKAYRIDPTEGILTIRRETPEAARKLFEEGKAVVAGRKLQSAPAVASATSQPKLLTTELTSGYRPAGTVRLAEPRYPPEISIRATGGDVAVSADGVTDHLPIGREYERELDPRDVTVRTAQVVDELVANPAVPKSQRSLKTEYGTVTVEAIPRLKARDYGELTVVDVNR